MTLPGSAAPAPLATLLIPWQQAHGRHALPWVGSRDPYRVWLSEIMLQQTQVATVLGYFERFLARFADVTALAAAHQDEVLALWSGLGYYSRARNMHRCAQVVVQQHGGRFPASSLALARLPGIGRSTAAAIAAFCFGERCAILDGNVKRVLTRALGFAGDLAEGRHEKTLWLLAEAQLPASGIEAYTQGLMDLGATICLTRRPACDACPLTTRWGARAAARPAPYPVKTRKLKRGKRAHALLWLGHQDQVWLVQRPQTGVWAGLWTLPEFESEHRLWALAEQHGWPGHGRPLATVRHVLTHFDWALTPCHWALPGRLGARQRQAVEASLPAGRWVARDAALTMGLPAPIRRLLEAGAPV